MFDTVLFDLDGTLTDPFEGITNSIVYALEKFGIEVADKRTLIDFIGPPLLESFSLRYGWKLRRKRRWSITGNTFRKKASSKTECIRVLRIC